MFVRFEGTGGGAVTLSTPGEIVAFLLTAATLSSLPEIAGELTVARSGPALLAAKTPTTPASHAASAAWIIGSGQARVFW